MGKTRVTKTKNNVLLEIRSFVLIRSSLGGVFLFRNRVVWLLQQNYIPMGAKIYKMHIADIFLYSFAIQESMVPVEKLSTTYCRQSRTIIEFFNLVLSVYTWRILETTSIHRLG